MRAVVLAAAIALPTLAFAQPPKAPPPVAPLVKDVSAAELHATKPRSPRT